MPSYYSSKLSAERLKSCYDVAPPSVQRYLAAEIAFVRQRCDGAARVLELGCGYGRVLRELAGSVPMLLGIDTSFASVVMACEYLGGVIVTTDGFSATTVSEEQYRDLAQGLGRTMTVQTVAGSSVFCNILV
jgi:SAM-dependent methyltransferase